MTIFSFGVSNSVIPVLTNIEKLPDFYLYLAEDWVLTNGKKIENMYISNPVGKKRPLSISTWKRENVQ